MKILIINFEYPPLGGGGGVATRDFARELAKRHDVHIITTWYRGLAKLEVKEGVTIHRVRVLGRRKLPTASIRSLITFVPAALLTGIALCRQVSFDVINAQFVVPSGIPAALLARLFNRPFVLSFIGGDIYDPSKGVSPHRYYALRWLIRLIARQATAATAISSDTKRRARELHGVSLPITVTPLGLLPSAVIPKSRAQLGLPEGLLAVSIGRLIPRKGYEQLLKVWVHFSDAHLAIVGEGPLLEKLQRLCTQLQLTNRVHVLGYVNEHTKMSLLQTASLYVSAASHEGFGIVFLEAMQAGLPIVATNNGGQTDFLRDGENALLIPPDNEQALREALQQMLKDTGLRQQMAETNRQAVQKFYIDKTCQVFEQVLLTAAKT